jgi:hypothetical protein
MKKTIPVETNKTITIDLSKVDSIVLTYTTNFKNYRIGELTITNDSLADLIGAIMKERGPKLKS